jgi:YgiT-type zinc finger domain-containing protein
VNKKKTRKELARELMKSLGKDDPMISGVLAVGEGGVKDHQMTCMECGGDVRLSPGVGRTRELERGVHLLIPDEYLIPTCSRCGEEYFSPEITEPLDAYLKTLTYDPIERAREKQASRDEDQRRLDAGEITREELRKENGKFAFPNAKMLLDKAKRLS